MPDIQLAIESPKPIYYPGDSINGNVIVNLSEETKANEVYLKTKGRAHVAFWHNHGNQSNRYSDKEVYFKNHITLWQKNEDKGEKYLPAGVKEYAFSFTIPHNAPPSLKATYGNVKYKLKAELDMPWKFDKTIKQEFLVASPIYLNSNPMYNQPYSATIQKGNPSTLSNCLQATVMIPRVAWVANEIIPVHINIMNNSSEDISSVEATIVKRESFTGRPRWRKYKLTKDFTKKINSVKNEECVPSLTTTETQIEISVPEDAVTLTTCPIMSIAYELKIELHTKGIFSSCPSTCIPIILSNVPMIQSSTPPRNPVNQMQPSTAYPQGYSTDSMPIAPPPYSLHNSNSTARDSTSSSDDASSQKSSSEIPINSSDNAKVPLDDTKI